MMIKSNPTCVFYVHATSIILVQSINSLDNLVSDEKEEWKTSSKGSTIGALNFSSKLAKKMFIKHCIGWQSLVKNKK